MQLMAYDARKVARRNIVLLLSKKNISCYFQRIKFSKIMKIAVIGGSGFVGTELIALLRKRTK